jgi:hypothetical protein
MLKFSSSSFSFCCFSFYGGDGRLWITTLVTTLVTSLISCVIAEEEITTDIGIPFLSVKICLFVPSLLLSEGLLRAVIAHLKATL